MIAEKAREDFEQQTLDVDQLADLYFRYNRIPNVKYFVYQALLSFPEGNCGLASVYMRDQLGAGEVSKGIYDGFGHTVLTDVGEVELIDITADQFGGPNVYVGEIVLPWQLR